LSDDEVNPTSMRWLTTATGTASLCWAGGGILASVHLDLSLDCLWKHVLLPVVVMLSLWWVAMPGGRAEAAHMLSTPQMAVRLRWGWYKFT
jgi:hypothetical protein